MGTPTRSFGAECYLLLIKVNMRDYGKSMQTVEQNVLRPVEVVFSGKGVAWIALNLMMRPWKDWELI